MVTVCLNGVDGGPSWRGQNCINLCCIFVFLHKWDNWEVTGTWWMMVFLYVFLFQKNALLIVVLKRIRNALITITSQKSFSLLILTTWVGREIKLSHLVGANANWQEWSDYPIPKCRHMSVFLYKCGHRSAFLYKFLSFLLHFLVKNSSAALVLIEDQTFKQNICYSRYSCYFEMNKKYEKLWVLFCFIISTFKKGLKFNLKKGLDFWCEIHI